MPSIAFPYFIIMDTSFKQNTIRVNKIFMSSDNIAQAALRVFNRVNFISDKCAAKIQS
jgi:hypothetical protein